jgi:hypothetical protein
LEIKKEEKEEKDREWDNNNPDWDIPAFLREK